MGGSPIPIEVCTLFERQWGPTAPVKIAIEHGKGRIAQASLRSVATIINAEVQRINPTDTLQTQTRIDCANKNYMSAIGREAPNRPVSDDLERLPGK